MDPNTKVFAALENGVVVISHKVLIIYMVRITDYY